MTCGWCGCDGATMPMKVPVEGVVTRLVVHGFCARELADWSIFAAVNRRAHRRMVRAFEHNRRRA